MECDSESGEKYPVLTPSFYIAIGTSRDKNVLLMKFSQIMLQ